MSRPGAIVAGIGFRHAAAAREILVLIRQALAQAGLSAESLGALATAADRAGEPAIREAAAAFGLEPTGVEPDALQAADVRVQTRSSRIEHSRGIGSLAEAAALAASGEAGQLVLPRIASASVTCALARSSETP